MWRGRGGVEGWIRRAGINNYSLVVAVCFCNLHSGGNGSCGITRCRWIVRLRGLYIEVGGR